LDRPLHQDNSNPDAAFDKTYFSKTPPTGRQGTSGRNQYYGPGLQNWNFATSKVFRYVRKESTYASGGLLQSLQPHQLRESYREPEQRKLRQNHRNRGQRHGHGSRNHAGVVGGGPRVIQGSLRVEF